MAKSLIIVGLDIGSSSIKSLAAEKKRKSPELEVLTTAEEISLGVRKGVVINPPEVANTIKKVLSKIEQETNRRINSVHVNIGGSHIFSVPSRGLVSVSRADQKISSEDIERVLQAAQAFPLPSNREIVEAIPREFIIDGEKGIKEALGMQGVRLEAEVLLLGVFGPYLKNLTSAVLSSGFQIEDLVFSPLASARATLTPKERELGVALLDVGAGTTGMAVFEEGELIHTVIFPIGSAYITNDIAIFLKTDVDMAERIKIDFGTLLFQGSDKKEKIKLTEGETLTFSHRQLSRVIEDRVSEIFGEVNKEFKKISKQGLLPSGIVLTGGCSKLPRIKELAKKELKLPCRIGKPQGFSVPPDDPRFSVACGLVLERADLEIERRGWRGSFSLPGKGLGAKIKKIFKIFIP